MNPVNLRLLTWNLSYGYGLGSEGTSKHGHAYEQKPRDHFEFVLNSMGDFIKRINVDVVFLQEVDFDASRSHHINQAEWISRRAGLMYRNNIVSWNCPYVPYPGLNPKNHFGQVRSGGSILSRYPLSQINVDLLPKPKSNPQIYNLFYLSRYLQICGIHLPHRPDPMCVMNLHLEAFDQENRELHLMKMSERLPDYGVDLVAGDFNGEIQLTERAQKDWQALPYEGATFPSLRPEQALDGFVMKKEGWSCGAPQVMDAGDLSDHRPLFLEVSGI